MNRKRLVAEASGDGDLVAALGAAAAEDGGACLGGHANEKAVDFAATATVGLEGALGHGVFLSEKVSACGAERQSLKHWHKERLEASGFTSA